MSFILQEPAASRAGAADPLRIFDARLAAADGSLQKEKGVVLLLRSWRWIGAWLLAAFAADVLLHLASGFRLALALGFLGLILGTAAWAACVAWLRRNPAEQTARVLEARDPRLGSKLINALQLRGQAADETLGALTRELAGDAVAAATDEIRAVDLRALAATRQPAREAKIAGIALAVLAVLLALSHDITRTEVPRFFDPFGDHPPYSFTRIEIAEPAADGVQVVYGQNVLVTAETHGHRPGDLFLTFAPPEQPERAVTVPMFARAGGNFAQQIEGVKSDLVLTAHTRDRHSRSVQRRISVVLTPRLERAMVKITPPAYTGLPPDERPLTAGKTVKALAGSRLEFRLTSNRPLREGRLDLVQGPGKIETVALTRAEERTVAGSFEAAEPGLLRFALVDEAGNASAETWESTLQVIHDLPPEVQVAAPSSDSFVALDFKVEPVFEANDDYGVKTLRLHQGRNGIYGEPRVINYDRGSRNARETIALDLAAMDLQSGDRLSFFAEAIDTAPEPQLARSQTVTLTVISVEEYNDFLRERTDMDDLAAKYADLFQRLQDLAKEQKELSEQAAAMEKQLATAPDPAAAAQKRDALVAKQHELNARLDKLAGTMEDFVRKDPLYDVEAELAQTLKKEAEEIRASTQANGDAMKDLAPRQADQSLFEDFQKAAGAQLAQLGATAETGANDVVKPLEDLSLMHEILKDINRFKELYAAQQQVAEQAQAYNRPGPLSREDQLALKDLAAREKRIGEQLAAVEERLDEDGALAQTQFPKAGQSARDLAARMSKMRLDTAASRATQAMLAGQGGEGAQLAQQLADDMAKLFSECNGTTPGMQGETDQYLSIQRGLKLGNSFAQMMKSRKFGTGGKPGFGWGQGEMGLAGSSGFAMTASPETPVLGHESRPNDQASSRPGQKGSHGARPEARGAAVEITEQDVLKDVPPANRESDAINGEQWLEQYHEIVDRYFKALTK